MQNKQTTDFPFKAGKKLTPDEIKGYASELTNCLWMWNFSKSDARAILELMLSELPNQAWPNNDPIVPKDVN